MGKYRNGRRVAVQGGRVLLEKVGNLVKGGAIPKPVWFEAMQRCPPPTLPFRHGSPYAAAGAADAARRWLLRAAC